MSEDRPFISSLEAQPPLVVGFDLTLSSVRVGVVDDLGRMLFSLAEPIALENGPELVSQRLHHLLRDVIDRAKVRPSAIVSVGVAWPGPVERSTGKVAVEGLHCCDDLPLGDRLSELCGLPVKVVSDVTAAAYGEFWVGAGRGLHSIVLMTINETIRCGLIIGDLSINETDNRGLDYGHTIVDCSALPCDRGSRGRLDAYARTQGLAETARHVAVGVVNIMHTLDPGGVLLAGAMTFGGAQTDSGRRFLACIKEEVASHAFRVLAQRTVIDFAALGDEASYLGAAGIARLESRRMRTSA